MKKIILKVLFVFILFSQSSAYSSETLEVFIVNLSEMNSQVKVTDLICNKVLHDDLIDAKSNLPINLCKG